MIWRPTSILTLFELLVSYEHIPPSFQTGFIIPIPKAWGEDSSNPNNYRRITLLSNLAKLFERFILGQLRKAGLPDKLHPLQRDFRKGLSCMHSAYILQEAVQHAKK